MKKPKTGKQRLVLEVLLERDLRSVAPLTKAAAKHIVEIALEAIVLEDSSNPFMKFKVRKVDLD